MSSYPVSAATHNAMAANNTSGTSTASSSAIDYQQTFMKLLATELQSQDPTQTMDPTTMVTQMVAINQLSDVAGIYSILKAGASATDATSKAASAIAPTNNQSVHNTLGGN